MKRKGGEEEICKRKCVEHAAYPRDGGKKMYQREYVMGNVCSLHGIPV